MELPWEKHLGREVVGEKNFSAFTQMEYHDTGGLPVTKARDQESPLLIPPVLIGQRHFGRELRRK